MASVWEDLVREDNKVRVMDVLKHLKTDGQHIFKFRVIEVMSTEFPDPKNLPWKLNKDEFTLLMRKLAEEGGTEEEEELERLRVKWREKWREYYGSDDKDGAIASDDIEKVLQGEGYCPTRSLVVLIKHLFNDQGNESLDMDEFVQMMEHPPKDAFVSGPDFYKAFDDLDPERKGYLTRQQLRTLEDYGDNKLTEAEIEEMWTECGSKTEDKFFYKDMLHLIWTRFVLQKCMLHIFAKLFTLF
ncbi:hypothetical protein ACJMK2_042415 [Sinanodonta woodiana]|uniref:Uncharacterized protein n=1 Tax=Sinanodonta woodiana TaxID=1069815 RepID=A0ABD3W947_SINWO